MTSPIDIKNQIPEFYRLFWQSPRIEGEKPKLPTVSSTTTPTLSSSSSLSQPLPSIPVIETVQVATGPTAQPIFTARIVINYECSDEDKLFIRGTGPNMSWGPGVELTRVGTNQWIYESKEPFETFDFKLALNDQLWEAGDNHTVESGKPVEITSVTFHDLS